METVVDDFCLPEQKKTKHINGNSATLLSFTLTLDVWIFATRGFKMSEL